jgi:hypothetical protein
LQQALEQEHRRTAALQTELGDMRREIAAVASRKDEEAAHGQPAEAVTAEPVQSRERQRDGTSVSETALVEMRRQLDIPAINNQAPSRNARGPDDRTGKDPIDYVRAHPGANNKPVLPAPSRAEAATVIARASRLLAQGNIAAARVVLERIAETGSAEASFALAETYDPRVLPQWGTVGTQADAAKALDLYSRAATGGIAEATHRVHALGQ